MLPFYFFVLEKHVMLHAYAVQYKLIFCVYII